MSIRRVFSSFSRAARSVPDMISASFLNLAMSSASARASFSSASARDWNSFFIASPASAYCGDALEKEARALAEDMAKFKKDAEIMSGTERAAREKELNTRRIDISYSERKLKEDVAIRERELTQRLMQQFQEVIEAVALEGQYDMVLQDPVYAREKADITDTVLERLRRKR